MSRIRIATRRSELALAQARLIARRVETVLGTTAELVEITTSGDRLKHLSLAEHGGKGLFIKELEEALLDDRADVAIHSAKDLPARVPEPFSLVAFPDLADRRDALVAAVRKTSLRELPEGARIGTGSLRRTAQLKAFRPDLEVVPLRGNVNTRLRKMDEEGLDAVILASAGLDRLGLSVRITERIDPVYLLPAVAQGILALETRRDHPLAAQLAQLDQPEVRRIASAERAFLAALDGDCNVPIAAHADTTPDGRVRIQGLVASVDGKKIARGEGEADFDDAEAAGREAANAVLAEGGAAILEELRAQEAE